MTREGYSQWWRPSAAAGGFSAGRIFLTSAASPSGSLSPIPFDDSDLDTDGYADTANNRIIIPTGFGGWFKVTMRVGVAPQGAGPTAGVAQLSLKTVADGLRDYEYKGWHELQDSSGHEAEYRIIATINFADGDLIYADWDDTTTGAGGFYIFGGNGSGVAAPVTYLQVERLGDS